jgi:hypothetical protein
MSTVTITADQLAQLQALVTTLSNDKATADQKTQVSNTADTAAAQANAVAAQAKLDEAAADATVSTDLTNLQGFIDGLVGTPTPTPAP